MFYLLNEVNLLLFVPTSSQFVNFPLSILSISFLKHDPVSLLQTSIRETVASVDWPLNDFIGLFLSFSSKGVSHSSWCQHIVRHLETWVFLRLPFEALVRCTGLQSFKAIWGMFTESSQCSERLICEEINQIKRCSTAAVGSLYCMFNQVTQLCTQQSC